MERRALIVMVISLAVAATWVAPAIGELNRPMPITGRDTHYVGGALLEIHGDRVVVGKLLPGSPAEVTGLLVGDVLLVVNDVNLIDLDVMSPGAVMELLERDSTVDLRLIVGRGGGTLGVVLSRALLDAPGSLASARELPRIGETAPSFEGRDLHGNLVRLDDLRGRPILLDFWASWCPPCREAAITLRRFAAQFGEALTIIGVSLDDDPRAFEAFVYNHHLPGMQIHDGGPYGPIASVYGSASAGIPYSILIAPDGLVLEMGPSLQAKEEAIVRLLAAAPDGNGD